MGLKFHHQISPIPSTNPDRKPLTNLNPFFRIKPIHTRSFSSSLSHLKSRRISSKGFKLKSPSSEQSNGNGSGGGVAEDRRKDGGGDGDGGRYAFDVQMFYLRCTELLLRVLADRSNVVTVGFPRTLGGFCAQVAWQMWLFMKEILLAFDRLVGFICVSVLLVASSVISVTLFWL